MNDINSKNSRPVSAAIKRPDVMRFSARSKLDKFKNDMPNIYLPNKTMRVISPNSGIERERVIEECMQLKSTLNNLNKELVIVKSEIHKKDKELNNKNKVLQDLYNDTHNNVLKSQSDIKVLQKLRDNNLLNNIKKQYQDIKKELFKKENELEIIKKTVKSTKIKELQSEIQIYIEELNKIKALYDISTKHNIQYESLIDENNILQENLNKQELLIINLKQDLKEAEMRIQELNDKQNFSKKEIKEYEKMDNKQLIKELNKKNRKIKDLEKEIQFYKNRSLVNDLQERLKDPRYLSENYQNKQIIINSFIKHKLNEFSVEKERTDKENENLKNRISQLEEMLKNNYNYEENKEQMIEILTDEDIQIYTYILIKNFEVKKISNNEIEKNLFHSQDKNDHISLIESNMSDRLISLLKINNTDDIEKINFYIKSVFNTCRYNYETVKNNFISFFSDIMEYSDKRESKLKKKLKKKLKADKGIILSAMQYYDTSNKGYINFINFRKVMQNLKISLEEKYTEFLIYIMKKFDDTKVSLEDLKYGNLIDLMENDNSSSDNQEMMVKSESNELAENDDGEVVITIEQFNEKVDKILSKLAEYLLNSKQKVKDCFKKVICLEHVNNESYEAIQLKDFIQIIQSIGIKLDTIDIYCIFTKLKYSDDFETIDLGKLMEEMFNYGIFDENLSKDIINKEKENIISKIRRYIRNHNINFDEFIFDILSKIFIIQDGGKMIRIINSEEFIEFLRDKSILKNNENLSDEEKKMIMTNKDINLNKLKEILENNEVEILNVTDKEKYNDESLGLGMIEDGEIEGLDI